MLFPCFKSSAIFLYFKLKHEIVAYIVKFDIKLIFTTKFNLSTHMMSLFNNARDRKTVECKQCTV